MKVQLMLVALSLAVAGPAAAEGYGTWAPNAHKPREVERKGFAPLPPAPAPASRSPSAGTPAEAQGFKPYRAQSVYSHPKGYGAPAGARPCKLSVYVNACARK